MHRRRIIDIVALGTLVSLGIACSGKDAPNQADTAPEDQRAGPEDSESGATRSKPPPRAVHALASSGLSAQELEDFYHLPEGSEVLPVTWLFALKDADTGKPFLTNPERFGFLGDPNSKTGVPVGMTADVPDDTSIFGGAKLAGFNCAACHVGELSYRGSSLRIVGAPNLLDIKAFYESLYRSVEATLKDSAKAFAFVSDVFRYEEPAGAAGKALSAEPVDKKRPPVTLAQAAPAPKSNSTESSGVWKTMPDLGKLEALGPLEKELSKALRQIHSDEMKPAPKGPQPKQGKTQGITMPKTELLSKELNAVLRMAVAPESPLANLPEAQRQGAITRLLSEFRRNVSLLKNRVAILQTLAQLDVTQTRAGYGRIDAFGTARNLLFPKFAAPSQSPVSYPHLFNLPDIVWFHWDANMNSAIERNMGQALGLGATMNGDFQSTLLPSNIHRLEQISLKLKPPAWPEDMLGPIDRARAANGAAVFQKYCAGCHGPDVAKQDKVIALSEIGTDPNRANSFADTAGNWAFVTALGGALGKAKAKAYERAKITAAEASDIETGQLPVVWRTPRGYPNRPLRGIWATAPYLHNGSVPTIYDLLLPENERPVKFGAGSREYDPEKLGYRSEIGPKSFLFDAAQPGNSNKGHSGPAFGTGITSEERAALIEYMKTL
jgi:mono/diheme cytochrome c family protein